MEGILPPETVAKIRTTAARRKATRDRKNVKRDEKRAEEKEARDATPETLWKRNREVANQTRLAELSERQERVFDLLYWMEAQVNGKYDVDPNDNTVYVGLEEGVADLKADIAVHGECMMEVVLLEFWKHPNTFAMLAQKENATSIFVRYGLVTAIPGHRLHEFETWLNSKKPAQPQPGNGYIVLQCACGSLPTAVPESIADAYRKLGKPYLCHICRSKDQKSNRLASPQVVRNADEIYDFYGRVKD